MSKKAARLGDTGSGHGCFPPTPIIGGSPDIIINGRPAARVGDSLAPHGCGDCPPHGRAISEGSSTVIFNGKPAARTGDAIDCGGAIISGSGDVIIGDMGLTAPDQPCLEAAKKAGAALVQTYPEKTKPIPKVPEQDWGLVNRLTGEVQSEAPLVNIGSDVGISRAKVITIKLLSQLNVSEPAVFKVDRYNGEPTLGDKNNLQWVLRDADTDENLLSDYSRLIERKNDKLIIHCVPLDWYGRTLTISAQFNSLPKEIMLEQSVAAAEVFDWIMTIRKAETEYSTWTPLQITNSMRRLAGYDGGSWPKMYGGIPRATKLSSRGILTQLDIDHLIKWTRHSDPSTGLVTDADGHRLAAGHVLTGISAGVYRDRSLELRPNFVAALKIGDTMDNLYASTLSGDLGQAAVYVNEDKQSKPYIGPHGDADDAELIGDIDGFILGSTEHKGGSGRKLSDTLSDYYCACDQTAPFRQRMNTFEKHDSGRLKDQIQRFATNYVYSSEGKLDGAFSEVKSEATEAFEEFEIWFSQKKGEEIKSVNKLKTELYRLTK